MTPLLPRDHTSRLERARLALDGLSVGDAFGGQFFVPGVYSRCFSTRTSPPGLWHYTDDTEMALGIMEVLTQHGRIDQYDLAQAFARRYALDMYRGYGATAHEILSAIDQGTPWRNASYAAFGGEGSMGNGSAMRIAPLGAYFADDLDRVASEAQLSAEVTHAHHEGRAGAVAVAVAAAMAWRLRDQRGEGRLLAAALERTPPGPTRDRLEYAAEMPPQTPAQEVGRLVGNGSRVTGPDTVPFTVWVADRYLHDYTAALWATVSAGGDVDTTCAIVGGIVALATGPDAIPVEWLEAREELK
jgi:ADP-ribosylglycohydrolase